MANETPSAQRQWSPKMKRLFDAKHYASDRLLAALDLPEPAALLEAAADPAVPRGQRVKALTASLYRDPPRTIDLLGRILTDEAADSSLRAVAASLVGRSSLAEAEGILIGSLDSGDDLLRCEIARALARVGSSRAHGVLEEAAHSGFPPLRNQALLAQAVIAYRGGLEQDPLPPIGPSVLPPAEEGEFIQLTMHPIAPDRIAFCLHSLEDTPFGLDVAPDVGFWVAAGRAEWALLLNARLAEDGLIASLARRRAFAGVLARRQPETDTFSTQYLVLTRPAASQRIEVMVYRTDGELFYVGRAAADDSEMGFSIWNAERPGAAPTFVRGRLGPDGVRFDLTLPSAQRRAKRHTAPLDLRLHG